MVTHLQAATSVIVHALYLSDTGRVHTMTSDMHFETAEQQKKRTRLLRIRFRVL
jgi:hypothetical protein